MYIGDPPEAGAAGGGTCAGAVEDCCRAAILGAARCFCLML
jgi:hypothetical protein